MSRGCQSTLQVPLCPAHRERCHLRTVKKAGPNKGRQFYTCPRAEGPARADRWTRARVCMAAILSMYRLMEVALARRGAADSEARVERPTANRFRRGARFILLPGARGYR